jgi:hypothetical protein
VVADGDALVEGCEDAESYLGCEGGLAEQDGCERGAGVEVVVGQQADGFQPVVAEEVCLIDEEYGASAAFG